MPCSGKRAEVQARDESAILGLVVVAVADGKLCLNNGVVALLSVQFRVERLGEVNVTIVS